METTKETTPKNRTHIDVYAMVTNRIIEQLEKGTVPWKKPWTEAGMPQNLISKKNYRGINIFLLASLGYDNNLFLSYKQVQDIGGKVKKDEKGYPVVYWNFVEKEAENAEDDEAVAKKKGFLRYYTVFNIAQCEDIPEKYLPVAERQTGQPIPTCEYIVANMPNCPEIRHKEQKAYYNPLQDFVNMPKQKSFDSMEAYYATLFHELIHSTGHHLRLARKDLLLMSEFGADAYSREELVAEIGSSYLQFYAGITSEFQQSTAYVQGWLWKLKNNKKFIFVAAALAQKATDYILNLREETEHASQTEE